MNISKPARVIYRGESNTKFTNGTSYEAFFLEYWQGERNSLHVRDNSGNVTDFNSFKDFEVLSDENNLLNNDEALVRCISHNYESQIMSLTYGKVYKAIGRDKEGLYLVMDDSMDCYFIQQNLLKLLKITQNYCLVEVYIIAIIKRMMKL